MSSAERTVAYADTNVCVALLAGPAHPSHDEALALFRRVADGEVELILVPVVVAELVYAARTVLRWTTSEAATRLGAFLNAVGLVVRDRPQIFAALEVMGARRIDFADAYLAAMALDPGPPVVASFDRDFDRIDGLRRVAS